MNQCAMLIKPASSNCNLRCKYCFYFDISEHNRGVMNQEVSQQVIKRAFESVDEKGRIVFSFQGGEPMVAGIDYFKTFVGIVSNLKTTQQVMYSLQTNGTLINEDWADFFYEHQFLIGVSLDGYEKNMNEFRFDAQGKGVYYQVTRGIQLLRKKKVEFNILTVVTKSLAQKPEALYKYYRQNKFDFIQLIPCLPSLNADSIMDAQALTPHLYAEFFIRFFECWKKDMMQGIRMDVNLFSNVHSLVNGYPPYQCGMIGRCTAQHVVEADGSVYPCDFYAIDELKLGNFMENTIDELRNSCTYNEFKKDEACEKKICSSCEFRAMCHGGCKRQNITYLSDEYCGYQQFLRHTAGFFQSLR